MKLLENQRLVQFLMGLNDTYVVVRGNILMTHPMPQIGQALSMVLQEERQREMQISAPLLADSSALLSQQRASPHPPSRPFSQQPSSLPPARRSPLFCNYCRRTGHSIDKCFKLQRIRGNTSAGDRMSRVAATVHPADAPLPAPVAPAPQPAPSFTHEQYTKLLAMLQSHALATSVASSDDSPGAAMLECCIDVNMNFFKSVDDIYFPLWRV